MQRTLLLLTITTLIVSQSALAQLCAPNNITTNPSAPVNNQRPSMINTFDWTMTDFPLNIRHIYFIMGILLYARHFLIQITQ